MSFHLSNIQDYHRFIAVDIGSYRVRTGLYDISSGKPVEIGYSSVRQDRKNMIQGSIADLRAVALTLERSIIQATKDNETIPEEIILAFGSRITLSDIITTQYIREEKNLPITMGEIDGIIKKIESESFERVREKAKKEFAIGHDDIRLISSTITAISIDGKNYTNPLGSTGANIRLTILNIFTPATDYNILRSVVASLGKKAISLIPTPLVFAKVIEKSEYMGRNTAILDIGYHQTTLILETKNEIIAFETFCIGSAQLIESILEDYPQYYSSLQIEKKLHEYQANHEFQGKVEDFFQYIATLLHGYIKRYYKTHILSQIFLHGGIFENSEIEKVFQDFFLKEYHHQITFLTRKDVSDDVSNAESVIPYGLSIMAHELLLIKKDPLIRILRYVLYNYE